MKGLAFVFLRKGGALLPTGPAGHVGWGFVLDEQGHCFCGSTENAKGGMFVPGGGDNDAWSMGVESAEAMIEVFRGRGYDGYKVSSVREAKPADAREVGGKAQEWGYTGIWNNCLDHAHKVLAKYGEVGMPWLRTHPAPNDWFAVYNGEYHNL
jgi:hypothetical protein